MTKRVRRVIVGVLASLGVVALGCVVLVLGAVVFLSTRVDPSERGRRFEVGWISDRLVDAGFVVTPPRPDTSSEKIWEVVSGECMGIKRADEAARYCVLRCRDDAVCRATMLRSSPLGESYMEVHREDTVLIQRWMEVGSQSPSRDVIFGRGHERP